MLSRFLALPVLAAILLAVAASPARAQDKAMLDLLVKKGVITQADADSVGSQSAVIVNARAAAVKKLSIGGMIDLQYDWLNTHDQSGAVNPPAVNQFILRRANINTGADLGNGWTSELDFNFTAGAQRSAPPEAKPTQQNFKKAIISKTFDGYGTATAGFQKVAWGQEETTSSSKLKTIERSPVSFFFDGAYGGPTNGRLGFGRQHVGLFWSGTVPVLDGFYYGAALTNGIQSVTAFGNVHKGRAAFNQFAYWTNAGYQGQYRGVGYTFGLNLGYASDANSTSGSLGVPSQNNAVYGYNPYLTLVYGRFALAGEFMQTTVENGRVNAFGDTSAAAPYGFLVTPSYQITDQWEVVTQYSYLNTNGRGTRINPVDRNAENTFDTLGFNNVWRLYFGFNYYIIGTAVELSAGYEFAQFSNRETFVGGPFDGPGATVSGLRTQIQMQF